MTYYTKLLKNNNKIVLQRVQGLQRKNKLEKKITMKATR